MQRSYLGVNVLFLISYIRVPSVIYLVYSLGFVITLVGKENSAMLIFRNSKKSCGVSINYYWKILL